jgi:hypothetical protein
MKPTSLLFSFLLALPVIANPAPIPASNAVCDCGGCAAYGSYWCGYTLHAEAPNDIVSSYIFLKFWRSVSCCDVDMRLMMGYSTFAPLRALSSSTTHALLAHTSTKFLTVPKKGLLI